MRRKVVKMSILKWMAQLFPEKLRKKFYVHESKQNPHRINSIEENDKLGSSRRVSAPQSASSQLISSITRSGCQTSPSLNYRNRKFDQSDQSEVNARKTRPNPHSVYFQTLDARLELPRLAGIGRKGRGATGKVKINGSCGKHQGQNNIRNILVCFNLILL